MSATSPVTPIASSRWASSSRNCTGPGCQRKASPVSRATRMSPACSCAAIHTARPQRSTTAPARRGARRSAARSVSGSWRTQNEPRPSHSTVAAATLPPAASRSRPLSRSSAVSAARSPIASRSAACRRRQRYGAVTSSSSEVGTAAACESFSVSSGSTWSSRWFRQPMFGLTAAARLTKPASTAVSAASFGSGSAGRTARSERGTACRPRRHAAVSRFEGTRSRQSLATSSTPVTATAAVPKPSPASCASAASPSAKRIATPRCHSWMRAPST